MNDNKLISDIVKVYPNMLKIVIYHNSYQLKKPEHIQSKKRILRDNNNADRSIRRTRTTISDIIACNKFDLWCTFTFNCKNCPVPCQNNPCICPNDICRRYDANICKLRMSAWLHRQKVNDSKFTYIIVPEYHKDGAIHFHAFIKHCNAKLKNTNKKDNGHDVYKFSNYSLGWSYVIDISGQNDENHNKIAGYMQKYIKKDMPMFHGKKRYFVSQNLIRPDTVVNGVESLGLMSVVKDHKPVYIDDKLEIQYHPVHSFNITRDKQSSLSLLSSVTVIPSMIRCKPRRIVESSH